MEGIILGLLLLKPMTGYELSQYIKQNLSTICSSSAGSIQTALKNLIQSGFVTFTEITQKNKKKKIFEITPLGNARFHQWLEEPMKGNKGKNIELSKLFFLGFLPPKKRVIAITSYIEELKQIQSILLSFQKHMLPNQTDILTYQHLTLDYGIQSLNFQLEWYNNLLKQMEESS